MKNEINAVLENMTTTTPEPEDYTGEDGLLYCGKCRKPKEAYFAPDKAAIFGRDRHPAECDCQRAAREEREAAEKRRRHLDTVEELKRRGFTDPAMRDWTFENDNGRNPQTGLARRYVEHWEDMRQTISAACSGAAWAPAKATLRAVSQTPSWRKKSPSA
jgi:DNA replication protein DnaC